MPSGPRARRARRHRNNNNAQRAAPQQKPAADAGDLANATVTQNESEKLAKNMLQTSLLMTTTSSYESSSTMSQPPETIATGAASSLSTTYSAPEHPTSDTEQQATDSSERGFDRRNTDEPNIATNGNRTENVPGSPPCDNYSTVPSFQPSTPRANDGNHDEHITTHQQQVNSQPRSPSCTTEVITVVTEPQPQETSPGLQASEPTPALRRTSQDHVVIRVPSQPSSNDDPSYGSSEDTDDDLDFGQNRKLQIAGKDAVPQIAYTNHPNVSFHSVHSQNEAGESTANCVVDPSRRVWIDRQPRKPHSTFFPPSANVESSTSNLRDYYKNFDFFFSNSQTQNGKSLRELRYVDGKFRTNSYKLLHRTKRVMKRRSVDQNEQNVTDRKTVRRKKIDERTSEERKETRTASELENEKQSFADVERVNSNEQQKKLERNLDTPVERRRQSGKAAKIIIGITLAVMFLSTFGILLGAGMTLQNSYFHSKIANLVVRHGYVVIFLITGLLGILLCFVGLAGLALPSKRVMTIFAVLLWPLAALSLAGAFLTLKDKQSSNFAHDLDTSWSKYYEQYEAALAKNLAINNLDIYIVQQKFQCCGYTDVTDRIAPVGSCSNLKILRSGSAVSRDYEFVDGGDTEIAPDFSYATVASAPYAEDGSGRKFHGCEDHFLNFKRQALKGVYTSGFTFACILLLLVFVACTILITRLY